MNNLVPFTKVESARNRYAVYVYYAPDPQEDQTSPNHFKRASLLKWKKAYDTCDAERAKMHAKELLKNDQYMRVEIKQQVFYPDIQARKEETFRIYHKHGKPQFCDLIAQLRKKIANFQK